MHGDTTVFVRFVFYFFYYLSFEIKFFCNRPLADNNLDSALSYFFHYIIIQLYPSSK